MEDSFVSVEEEIASFKRYFDKNNRCILSAQFGEGKSCFLNEFVHSQSNEYDFITIYPTNYQICDNRDILEYIKRDILFGLIALNNKIIDEFDSSRVGVLKKAIFESKENIIGCIPDLNVSVCGAGFTFSISKVVETLLKISESAEKYTESEANPFKEYLLSFDKEKGGIYEMDAISDLICFLVQKRRESKKKVALVIEDLDRIDPGHIFRILNVLSAHMTYCNGYDDGSKNKFKFDKILLLCDVENIEKIYHHLYGETTDFKGYISKFTAVPPFKYSIRTKIARHIGHVIGEYVEDDVVSNVLAEAIMPETISSNGTLLENIRNIKERIRYASTQYKVDKLFVGVEKRLLISGSQDEQAKNAWDKLFVTTDKPLMAFLSICKAFSISARSLLEKVAALPRSYGEANHVFELLMLLSVPLMSDLTPVLDLDLNYRLAASDGPRLLVSENGEIVGVSKENHRRGIPEPIIDEMLDMLPEFDKYLF